ncbi:Octanoyltransferase [Arsenophonus endosymbiont of Aleurodicus dispersus]|uniref:lipoyl(octanoyl) transferase LipB n=1 Tax=Arsenophonus endosymbiont of Aleurodicus dispersus TaxID=235559 RepID=UPI000EAC9556|nr:lipoyl(octanoyl) transferase LipB [Arsenophonus endosymbiont of Aleurodicus dispersus]VAY02239.1 Octanoyltransferase [Arsenophonus endosymbiont of Aleurodicus dispersus]
MLKKTIILRQIGLHTYQPISDEMYQFTKKRTVDTLDELWLAEHHPVFTQGQAGKKEHILSPGNIPVIQSNRGGQITYHGPGQQIMYVLLDLKRNKISVRELVTTMENTVINTLSEFGIIAYVQHEAPGVYVDQKKICSLGLRIHKGCSFHGLALNINMDLTAFQCINPCGYVGMQMTQLNDLIPGSQVQVKDVKPLLIKHFCNILNFQLAE